MHTPTPIERSKLATILFSLSLIALITVFHYATHTHEVAFHNLYRRLYYLPILLLSFAHGLRGGLFAAVLACICYTPHAFFSDHLDPSPWADKLLEMVLYVVVGGLTGHLVERQQRVQHALESALEEKHIMESQLVRAGRLSALGQLTSGLAHEIRNPLTSILGCAESLAQEFPDTHRKHRVSQILLHEIERLNKVVTDFLHFARPTPLNTQREVDLAVCLREVRDLTQPQANQLSIDAHLDLPPQPLIQGDPGQLTQVLLNIVLNAHHALQKIDAPRTLRATSNTQTIANRTYLRLELSNNGPPISLQDQEKIFNPYFTTRPEGTGLGLTISHRILEAHQGFIDLQSQQNQTSFAIVLPISQTSSGPTP